MTTHLKHSAMERQISRYPVPCSTINQVIISVMCDQVI